MLHRKYIGGAVAFLPLAWILAGCGEKPAPKGSSPATTAPKIDEGKPTGPEEGKAGGGAAKGKEQGKAGAVEGWGTITGTVILSGAAPEPTVLVKKGDQTVKNPERCATQDLLSEDAVVNKDNMGVKWVLAYIEKPREIHPDLKTPEGEAELGQEFCHFIPHMLAMREGQKLKVSSNDPIGHNTNMSGFKNPGWNEMIPPPKEGEKSTVDGPNLRAEKLPMPVKCNVHGWMSAHIAVFDHPYFAVTDDKGAFHISNVPAGENKLLVWQERVGFEGIPSGKAGIEVEVQPGETTDLGNIAIKLVK